MHTNMHMSVCDWEVFCMCLCGLILAFNSLQPSKELQMLSTSQVGPKNIELRTHSHHTIDFGHLSADVHPIDNGVSRGGLE